MKTTCGFCKAVSVMEPVEGKVLEKDRKIYWIQIYSCHHCEFYSVAIGIGDPHDRNYRSIPQSAEFGIPYAEEHGAVRWFPSDASSVDFEGLPANIATAVSEAHVCLRNGQLVAAAITARAALEALVKDQGITERIDLYKKIEKLRESGEVTQLLTNQAHAIRDVGNEMAHGDFDALPDKEEVEHIVEFMDALIDTLYVQPAKLEAAQDKRNGRRQQP